MKKSVAFIVIGIAVLLVLLSAGCVQQPAGRTPRERKSTSSMPVESARCPSSSRQQIDGYIAWQPFVSIATDAKIGKLVTYSQGLPPQDQWNNHPCVS